MHEPLLLLLNPLLGALKNFLEDSSVVSASSTSGVGGLDGVVV